MKINDIVRVKADTPWAKLSKQNGNQNGWDYPGRVTRVDTRDEVVSIEILEGPYTGSVGGFRFDQVELVDVNKSLSDKELANKYRLLRKEAQEAAVALRDRGYSFEYKSYINGQWTLGCIRDVTQEYRFSKEAKVEVTV